MKPLTLLIGISGLGLGLLSGCGDAEEDSAKPTVIPAPIDAGLSGTEGAPAKPPEPNVGPDDRPAAGAKVHVLTLDEFAKPFFKELEGHKALRGEFIEVEGKIGGFGYSIGHPYFTLTDTGKAGGVPYYSIAPEPWARVSQGQPVKVRGWFRRSTGWFFEFLEIGEPAAVSVPAEELVAEILADERAASEKYRDKQIRVVGECIRKQPEEGEALTDVVLKGSGGYDLVCYSPDYPRGLTSRVTVGESYEVLGEYLRLVEDEKCVYLISCFVVTEKSRSSSGNAR